MSIRNLLLRSIGVLDKAPSACIRCGAPVVELDREHAAVAAHLGSKSSFYGKVPYVCASITCRKIMYGPSKKNPKKRCCI